MLPLGYVVLRRRAVAVAGATHSVNVGASADSLAAMAAEEEERAAKHEAELATVKAEHEAQLAAVKAKVRIHFALWKACMHPDFDFNSPP